MVVGQGEAPANANNAAVERERSKFRTDVATAKRIIKAYMLSLVQDLEFVEVFLSLFSSWTTQQPVITIQVSCLFKED